MTNYKASKFDESALNWDADEGRRNTAKDVAEGIKNEIPLRSDMYAMDFGAGTGLVTFNLIAEVGQITAVDHSPGMIDVLQTKIDEHSIKNIRTVLLKEEGAPLPQGTFQLIFSSMTLHHVKEYEALLQQFYERLSPGGYLAIGDLEEEPGDFHSDNSFVEHHGFNPDHLASIVKKTGFESVRYRRVHTIQKETAQGAIKSFPVFLLAARKPR